MRSLINMGLTFMILSFVGFIPSIEAEEIKTAKSQGKPSVSLRETEITESLRNIIGSFTFEEMEIVGSVDNPQFNFVLKWKDPIPFQDEDTEVPRSLIDPYFGVVDQEGYEKRIHITTGD